MRGERQGRAGERGDEMFQMERGSFAQQYQAEKCPGAEDAEVCTDL